jgi:hypothetical protein
MQIVLEQAEKKEDRVSKIIQRVLIQVFGQEATRLIYRYLEHNYGVRRDEVGAKIDVFAQGLEAFLTSGAYAVEKKILEDIYSNYGQLRRSQTSNLDGRDSFVTEVKSLIHKA